MLTMNCENSIESSYYFSKSSQVLSLYCPKICCSVIKYTRIEIPIMVTTVKIKHCNLIAKPFFICCKFYQLYAGTVVTRRLVNGPFLQEFAIWYVVIFDFFMQYMIRFCSKFQTFNPDNPKSGEKQEALKFFIK